MFTPKEFQPFYYTFSKKYYFVGPEMKERFTLKDEKYNKAYDFYISLGSINAEKIDFVDELINDDYFNNRKIIINIGNKKVKPINSNIDIVNYTNQMELLKHTKYFINQAGINSVYEAIYNNVFEICIPMQEEQKMTAKIVQRKKLGCHLNKFEIEKIKKAINKFEDNKKYKKQLEKFNNIISNSGGAIEASKIIISYMEKI